MIQIPPNELRKFKYGILHNKLKYVIIQDKNEDCAQVSLVVKAGSMNEPEEHMGLAHFLEHMLFLGSKKHIKESYFEEMVNEMGGSTNAFTAGFETCYYMSILSKNLDKILSIYSRFFIDPLFDSNSITREINSINSEHLKNVNNEYWFMKQIIHNLSLKNSGINRFSTGTLETLGAQGTESHIMKLREEMIKFYNKYYCSNNMCITIQSNEDIDIVEKYIVKYFSEIKESNITIPNCESSILQTKFDFKNREYQIFPISESSYVLYMWDIMTKSSYMYNNAIDCISATIMFNGVNNITNILKQNGLAISIETLYLEEGIYILKINMNKGSSILLKNQIRMINNIIKKYMDSLLSWDWDYIYKYQLEKDRVNYNFGTKISNMSLVNMIAMNLHYFKEENVYNGEMIATNPDINKLKQLLKLLEFNKANIFYCTKDKIGDIDEPQEDKYYLKKYGRITNTFLDSPELSTNIFAEFTIELDMNLLNIKPIVVKELNQYEIPTLIDSMVWYGASSRFNEMIVCGSIYLSQESKCNTLCNTLGKNTTDSNMLCNTVDNYMLTFIAISLLNHYISLYFSQDFELGYTTRYSFNIMNGFIELSINGYNYNYSKFLYKVLEYVKTIKPEEIIINMIIDKIIENLKNTDTLTALEYASYIMALQQYKYMYSHIDKLKYISILLNGNEGQDYVNKITTRLNNIANMKNLSIMSIFYGNITMHDIPIIKSNQKSIPLPKPNIPKSISIKHPNKQEKNKAIIMLFPCGTFFPPIIAKVLLLDMLMSQPAYEQLRTKSQLGYIVNCSMICDNTNYYMRIKVQSHFNNNIVESKINNFLEYFKQYLDKLDQTVFNNIKTSLYTMLLKKPNNIGELMDKYIDEIEDRTFIFYRNELLASYLDDIELNNIKSLYNNIIKTKIVIKIN